MTPHSIPEQWLQQVVGRREWLSRCARLGIAATLTGFSGCSFFSFRQQSPDAEDSAAEKTRLVGDMAISFGLFPAKVESVGLITGLDGTGSDPGMSPYRDTMLTDMQKRGVLYPEATLRSVDTELVLVRGFLRPGIQKGDRFDVEVRVIAGSEATSLRGGWLMECRLKELAITDNRMREGDALALADGAVLVDPLADPKKDRIATTRGRVLGGGVSLRSRPLGLVMKPKFKNVFAAGLAGEAINRRFHVFEGGIKNGVAKPRTDEYIEIKVHPRYKDNIDRYIRVIRSVPIEETPTIRLARLQLLERQLLDPLTSADAAARLEAIGKESIDVLHKGIASTDQEIRFYSAEALAYLDQSEAAPLLVEAARDVAAFRPYALTALSSMDDYAAFEALRGLLSASSAKTRYGAFRALWAMNSSDPFVRGEDLGGRFSYHRLDVEGPPMIHLTRSFRAEVVLFGKTQRLTPPVTLEAGKSILITTRDDGQLTISKFEPNQPDQKRVVSNDVDELIRGVVELGGRYPDVVQILFEAKQKNALQSRLEIDALPDGGVAYTREEGEPEAGEASKDVTVSGPVPSLFSTGKLTADDDSDKGKSKDPAPTQ